MPRIRVVFYREQAGKVPVLEWLDTLPTKIQDKCVVKIERLRDELRIGREGTNYRILYFFHGRVAAILAHGLVKEREVPDKDIKRAVERKRLFEQDPDRHTYLEDSP